MYKTLFHIKQLDPDQARTAAKSCQQVMYAGVRLSCFMTALFNNIELAIQCHKGTIGNCIKARVLPQQKTKAWISASALNRMTSLRMPVSVKKSKKSRKTEDFSQFLIYSNNTHLI